MEVVQFKRSSSIVTNDFQNFKSVVLNGYRRMQYVELLKLVVF